jgi:hypothetical protein
MVQYITLLGKRYRLRWVPRLGRKGKGDDGDCNAPTDKDKAIRIRMDVKGQDELETYVHEMEHACAWWLDEEFVRQKSHDIAKVLWRLGYRRV